MWCMSYLGKWAAWVINRCELFHLFRVLCATHLLCMFKDLKDWASSEVVFGHQPAGVDRYGRGALHQDHWLCTSCTDFPGSSKQRQSFTWSGVILTFSDVASHKLFFVCLFCLGDRWTSTAAAEPANGTRVHESEAGTSHQAVPPHWEGQAGILPAVCHITGNEHLIC